MRGGLGGAAGSRWYRAWRWRVNLAQDQNGVGVGMRLTEERVREASAGFDRRATIRSRPSADDSADIWGPSRGVKVERRGVLGPEVVGSGMFGSGIRTLGSESAIPLS